MGIAGDPQKGPFPANERLKAEVVMRMLAGEPSDALSRELGVHEDI